MMNINSGVISPDTSSNNGKKIAIDSNGVMYACYSSTINIFSQISIMKSIDNGNTWINTEFLQIPGYNQITPCIAIDSNNKVHVVWSGSDSSEYWSSYSIYPNNIKYSNNVSGVWSAWTNISTGKPPCYTPNIIIDSNNKLHVAYEYSDTYSGGGWIICYLNNVNGTWGNSINLMQSMQYLGYPNIALDSNNKVYIVWYATSSTYQIYYSNNVSGTFSAAINIQTITGYNQQYPSIAIDSNNKVHVAWYGNDASSPTYYQIKYSNNVSGAWSTWINIQTITGYNQQTPSIAIDKNNKAHITWYGLDSGNPTYNQIKYINNVSGTWSTWINKTSSITYGYVCPSIAYYNKNVYCVYNGVTTVEGFISSIYTTKYLLHDKTNTKNSTGFVGNYPPSESDFLTNGINDPSRFYTQSNSLLVNPTISGGVICGNGTMYAFPVTKSQWNSINGFNTIVP